MRAGELVALDDASRWAAGAVLVGALSALAVRQVERSRRCVRARVCACVRACVS